MVDRTCSGIGSIGLTGRTEFSTLLEFGFLTSLLESFWVLGTLVLSWSPYCIPLYSTMTYTQERNKTNKNKLELVNLILPWATFHLCLSLRASIWSLLEKLYLELMTMHFLLIQPILLFLSYVTLISWFNKYQRLELCDTNIHVPFSITFGTSTPRLLLTLLWCMVHHG
jgi:hypothetical protein